MNKMFKKGACAILMCCLTGITLTVLAHHHHEGCKDDKHETHKKKRHGKKNENRLTPVIEPVYKQACGGCHLAYPPILLPAASWNRILDGLKNHFGQTVSMNQEEMKTIRAFLDSNAADHSPSKISGKIMKSLFSKTILRITEVPFIVKKHKDDDIPADAFQRESVGSLSNCAACHANAEQGHFDDDDAVIPK